MNCVIGQTAKDTQLENLNSIPSAHGHIIDLISDENNHPSETTSKDLRITSPRVRSGTSTAQGQSRETAKIGGSPKHIHALNALKPASIRFLS
jgi:hypothetical protein